MTITTDFSVTGTAIAHVSGTATYTTLELHAWLQALAAAPAEVGDDHVSILGVNPSELAGKRNAARPSALTLLNSYTINDAASQYFYAGSVEQSAGATLYTGVNTIGAGLTGRSHYVVQNGAKYNSGTKWWAPGPVRALFKVKTGGTLIGTGALQGYVTVYSREWGYTFSHFDVDCSAGSEQVAALSVGSDSNATLASANFTAGTNTVTSTSPATVVTLVPGTVSRDIGSGAHNYKGIIQWTNGARLSTVWQALQWACSESSNGLINGVAGWQYRKLDPAYAEILAAPFGTLAGGKWLVAQGWWIDVASLHSLDLQGYALVADDGSPITPPVADALSVGNLLSGDYVLVGKDASGFFPTSSSVTSTGTAGASTLTLTGSLATDVIRGIGCIRVNGNPHTYTSITGSTVNGLSPVVPVGGYSGAATWFPYIDKQTTLGSETSNTFTHAGDFTGRVRVRRLTSTFIVPFETTFSVASGGGSVNAIRTLDE